MMSLTLTLKLFYFIIILILYFCKFIICQNDEIKNQILEISYTYVGTLRSVIELNNLQFIVVPDRVKDLTLLCESKCPVEWKLEKFRYENFGDELRNAVLFKSTRYIDKMDYINISKYNYTSEIHFIGSYKVLTGNYICSCINEPNINRPIYIYWEGSSSTHLLQNGQSFHISKSPGSPWVTLYCGVSINDINIYLFKEHGKGDNIQYESLSQNTSVTVDLDGFHLNLEALPHPYGQYICSNIRIINISTSPTTYARYNVTNTEQKQLYYVTELDKLDVQSQNTVFFETSTNTLMCCSNGDPYGDWFQAGYWCETAQTCNFLAHRLEKEGFSNARDKNETCSSFRMDFNLPPEAAVFRCSMPHLNAQGLIYFSLDSVSYFSQDNVKPENMVRILPDTKNSYYIGSPLRFNCSASHYMFSEGLIWVGTLNNETTILIDKFMSHEYYRIEKVDKNKNEWIELRIFNPTMKSISCLVPVWSTQEWWNSTHILNLTFSSKPKFDDSKNQKEVWIDSDDTEITLKCIVSGVPIPKIQWLNKDLKKVQPTNVKNISVTQVSSELKIFTGNDVSKIIGTYLCDASNPIGMERFHINLQIKTTGPEIIIGITIGILLLFTIVLVLLLRKVIKQKKALRHLTEAEIHEFEKGNPEALANWKDDMNGCTHLLPYNTEYEIPPTDLSIDNTKILGQGTFGIVVKGSVKKGKQIIIVAVKTIRPNEDVTNFKILLSELKIMAYIGRHENIVCLVGASSRNIRNRELMIAIEFCDNGSLFSFLRKNRFMFKKTLVVQDDTTAESTDEPSQITYQNEPNEFRYVNQAFMDTSENKYENQPGQNKNITSKDLILWSIQIANGMEFLASKKVVHADLATRNILLTTDLNAKIGDFGLSKHLFEYSIYTKKTIGLLPWKWMAIESLRDMEFSVMSDVWSYGVLLWEIFSLAEVPYPGTTWTTEFLDKLTNGFRLPKPQHSSSDIYEVMLKCMRSEPFNRPSFKTVKEWQTKIYQRISTLEK